MVFLVAKILGFGSGRIRLDHWVPDLFVSEGQVMARAHGPKIDV
jgi:hypothetical protein